MLRIEYLVFCISLVLICKEVSGRGPPPKVQKRHDEVLQTYIFEPNDDYQADATTAFPPLVEYDSVHSPIVDDPVPDTPIHVSEDRPEAPPLPPPPPKPLEEVLQTLKSPDGPVVQYVNSYGGPYYTPSNSYPSNQYPSNSLPTNQYPSNYYPGYPWQYISQAPYLSQQNGQPMPPNYLPMQPEYEGILVPVQTLAPPQRIQSAVPVQSTQQSSSIISKNPENKLPPTTNRNSFDLALILQALLPPSVISFIIAIGNFILNSFSTLAFAGAITSVLCSLTPICTISFGSLGFRQMLINGGEVTTLQRVRRAAEVVSNALEKYENLQKGVESLTNSLKKAQRIGKKF